MSPHTRAPETGEKRSPLLLLVYQAGLGVFGLVYLALRLLRRRPLEGARERLAFYTDPQRKALAALNGPVWIHLVSVGEALAARPLVEEMRRRFPERGWLITTTTSTGRSVAKRLVREGKDVLLYLPWDFAPVVRRAVRAARPRLFLSFETELWPVLFDELARAGVPVAVVNGRISPAAYRRYLWARPLMRRALAPVGAFFAQSPQDARRFAGIGAALDRIAVTGNLKWDQEVAANGAGVEQTRAGLGLAPGALLWTAGSTHEGEERLLLQAHAALRSEIPGLRLVLAPRHPERVAAVERDVQAAGMRSERRSKVQKSVPGTMREKSVPGTEPVVVLDTVGELAGFYAASDVVFVGGSLVPRGGHNLVEPAALSKPIVTGSHLYNFQAIAEALGQAGGMAVVKSPEDLEEAVRRLLNDPAARATLGRRANEVFTRNRGAAARTAELIARRWGDRL